MESTLCFSLLILLSSLSLLSSQYVFPDHYFINCGSNAAVSFTGQSFIGDGNSDSISVSGGRAATENNRNPTSIYETARVFTEKSWYELQADQTNTFVMVRLHFSPISSNEFDFSASKFNVSVYGFSVLTNFSVGNSTVIEEFVIPIGSEKSFRIEFTPSQGSSMAFVNAIEAFTTPDDLFTDETYKSTSPLIPIRRINVGGQMITVADDTLRRSWVPDDFFIFNSESAKNATHEGQIMYQVGGATRFDAPDNVYNTAKQLNTNSTSITWNFEVNKNTSFMVRAHFCDIISTGLRDPNGAFDFFINNNKILTILPVITVQQLAAPFYFNFMADSDDPGFLNISIRLIENNNQTPFLNGLEIMKILQESRRVDPVKEKKKKNKSVLIIVGCVIGGVAFLLALFLGFFIGSKYQKVKPVAMAKSESHVIPSYGGDSYTSVNTNSTVNHPSPIPNLNLGLRVPFSDILFATKDFDSNLMIGQGGFGKVYKGIFPNGTKVAVKRGEKGHGQGRPEFVTEILVLSKIRHRHLVSLIGYCDERSEMILVYEFMEKGTLQDHLYNSKMDHSMLTWKQRLDICISAAQGLHYLHTGSDGGIIHRDVKSTNILLTENYVAKVADFGISRLDNVEESEFSEVKGSFGYLDPEYISCMKLTQKSDVYSFGVVLLEVLCARPALDNTLPHKEANLADWAIRQIKNGEVEKIIDPLIAGTINTNSLRKFLDTAERCLKDTGDERPTMIDVLWDLEYALQLQQTTTIREPHEDSTMNSSLQLPMSMLHRLPSRGIDDDSEVNHSSVSSYPNESQVFSQLKIDEAR